jgi:hypothetical protein
MSAPERIWVCPDDETWQAGNWDLASDGMENEAEYIRADVAQAQREEAVKRALEVAALKTATMPENLPKTPRAAVHKSLDVVDAAIRSLASDPATVARIAEGR